MEHVDTHTDTQADFLTTTLLEDAGGKLGKFVCMEKVEGGGALAMKRQCYRMWQSNSWLHYYYYYYYKKMNAGFIN